VKDTKLRFYLINELPEKVILLPKKPFTETILKARELCPIHSRADAAKFVNQVQDTVAPTRWRQLYKAYQNSYWLSIEKTAFSPGPGCGLWEFVIIPYGLTGATQICQRGLDELFCEYHDCVDDYVDDVIIFSDDMDSHITDLR